MAVRPQPVRSTGPSLVISTQLVEVAAHQFEGPSPDVHWRATLYPDAFEAVVSFDYHGRQGVRLYDSDDDLVDEVEREEKRKEKQREASRRAAATQRRYIVANRLDRLGTLTYAEACYDPEQARSDVGAFFRSLRAQVGRPFPYLWVPEWHPGGHGLHLHFAVGRFIPQGVIKEAWGRGIVDIRRRRDLAFGASAVDEARQNARYLAKYVSKSFDDRRPPGSHRFDVAQGFQPRKETILVKRRGDAVAALERRMGGRAAVIWDSEFDEDWDGPPSMWMAWAR